MSFDLKQKKAIIVGAGISGATLANILANKGWEITIYEKQNHIGGNCYDSYDNAGILIHNYGPHIFHTSYEDVYSFISQFTKLNSYVNKVLVSVNNKLFPLPINFKSIEVIFGDKAKQIIELLKQSFPNKKTITFFELKQVDNPLICEFVDYISKNVYFNYSSKMWGTKFENIDPSTINRVKIILGYEHNYFPEDKYQGLPIDGYTKMIEAMLNHKNIKVVLNCDAKDKISFSKNLMFEGQNINCPIIYCGPLDELLNYKYGILPYRSLDIKFETIKKEHFQDVAVINYPADLKMTRITEYKLMTLQSNSNTTISREYPGEFKLDSKEFSTRFYPIINETNLVIFNKYKDFFSQYNNFYTLGRLAQYKYFDMDDAIKQAIELAKEIGNE